MNLCTACPLYKQANHICIYGEVFGEDQVPPKDFKITSTKPRIEVMLVAQNPGDSEDVGNRVLIGPTGSSLRSFLRDKFPDASFYLTNAVKCHTTDNKTPTTSQARICAEKHLKKEIEAIRPRAIIALGSVAWQALDELFQTRVDFSGIVGGGLWSDDFGTYVLAASYHPSLGFETSKSIKGNSAAVQGSRVFRQLYLVISSVLNKVARHDQNFARNSWEVVDVENDSRGLNSGWRGPVSVVGRFDYEGPISPKLMGVPPKNVLGWNVGYDMMVLWERYGYYIPDSILDVKVWHRLIDDEEPTALGLKQAAFQEDGWHFWGPRVPRKKYVDGLMAWSHSDLSAYNTKDCISTRVLYEKYNAKAYFESDSLKSLCSLDSYVTGLICPSMEWHGISVNNSLLNTLKEEHEAIVEKTVTGLQTTREVLDSPKQFGAFLRSRGYAVKEGTGAPELTEILKDNQFLLNQIQDYRYSQKVVGTFLEGMVKYQEKGRVHYPYSGFAETGRLRNRGLHQLPKGDRVRSCLIPSEGKVFLKADVNQLEIGGIALQSGDKQLISDVRSGVDVHTQMLETSRALGVTHFDRTAAKSFNFAAMYGGSVVGLSKRFGLQKKQTQGLIDFLYTKYPNLKAWHDQVQSDLKAKGWVESIFGRKRRNFTEFDYGHTLEKFHWHFLREAINFQIQSYGADLTKELMRRTFVEIGHNTKSLKLLMYIHDELVLEGYPEELETFELPSVREGDEVLGVVFPFDVTWAIKNNLECWV